MARLTSNELTLAFTTAQGVRKLAVEQAEARHIDESLGGQRLARTEQEVVLDYAAGLLESLASEVKALWDSRDEAIRALTKHV